MKIKNFQILNFRSINDSGVIDASRITALLGRNESGKSNLLRGLHTLNPAEGFVALNPIKDFPRHRKLTECTDSTPVVSSVWELDDSERAELTSIWPRAKDVTEVQIGRHYGAKSRWARINVSASSFNIAAIKGLVRKIVPAINAKAESLEEINKVALVSAADAFNAAIAVGTEEDSWAAAALPAISTIRGALAAASVKLDDGSEADLNSLQDQAEAIPENVKASKAAHEWVLKKLPVFLYLDDYPEIKGHQDINQYIARQQSSSANEADRNFQKLCKVAGLNPTQLQELLRSNEQEARAQLVNRAGAVITTEIRKRWRDRNLKIRFNLDAQHFDTLVSDPNAIYDVEVNLDERSRGFQWFFAFYVVFAADTDGGNADNAVLLLDEPGLYLHAKSQGDLLKHLEDDFTNQIIYTTHSPFMVPAHRLESVRTVNIDENAGTTVSNDPKGDARTLFPLQAALGYDLAQSLFVGPSNLVVEGVTDFWMLSAISEYLNDIGRVGLRRDLTITPAGGAQKVHYMVALLTSEQLNVLVLLDDEKEAKATRDDLVKGKLIRNDNIVFVTKAFAGTVPNEADIEDVLDASVYEALVRESYAKELAGKSLVLNAHIPRIAHRIETGLSEIGIGFHKTRPARLFLMKIANDPTTVLTPECIDRFERLCQSINAAFDKHLKRKS